MKTGKELLLEHYKNPRNFGIPENLNRYVKGFVQNLSCGDEITFFLLINNNKISDAKFTGEGCSICLGVASILTEKVKNLPPENALDISLEYMINELELQVNDARKKCVFISIEALHKALKEPSKQLPTTSFED